MEIVNVEIKDYNPKVHIDKFAKGKNNPFKSVAIINVIRNNHPLEVIVKFKKSKSSVTKGDAINRMKLILPKLGLK